MHRIHLKVIVCRSLQACSNRFDVACFVLNKCWAKFGCFLGIITGVLLAVGGLVLAAKMGLLMPMLSTLARVLCCLAKKTPASGTDDNPTYDDGGHGEARGGTREGELHHHHHHGGGFHSP